MVGLMVVAVIARAMNAAVPVRNAAGPWVAVKATPMARLMHEAVASAAARMFFVFIFSFPDVPGHFLFSSFAGPWRACCGSLGNEHIKIQIEGKNYFYFF
jgi:hypothetical protein